MNSRIGAAVLIGLAALYLVLSLALGRSATAEPPPDLALHASDAGIEVLRAAGAILDGAIVVDTRSRSEFEAYHVHGSVHASGATASVLRPYAQKGTVIVVASRDEEAQKLVGAARAEDPKGKYFYLKSGVREWYLTFALPVALFSDQAPPHGYERALHTLEVFLSTRDAAQRERARMALFELARINYQPTLLGAVSSKSKTASGPRKKISGGCGG